MTTIATEQIYRYTILPARYNGTCKRCGGSIKTGQLIQYFYEDKRASHALPGECLGPVEAEQVAAPAPVVAAKSIHDGFYTVVIEGQGHRTFRIHTQPTDADFAPGKQIISYLSGPEEYMKFGFVQGGEVRLWKRFQSGYTTILEAARFLINSDHQAAGKMYALQSGNCWKCNRMLTDPLSIELGIGPTCRNKL